MNALRVLVLLAMLGVSPALAQMDVERVIAALKAREGRVDKLRVSAEWRWFRGSADDWYDTSAWKQPDFLPEYDIDYMIVRPWWQVAVLDLEYLREKDPNTPWARFAWVEGELTYLQQWPGHPAECEIVNHRHLGILRGQVFLTPLELELFDRKETLLEVLSRAAQVKVKLEGPHEVLVEFPYPEYELQTIRARLDLSRDAVPLMYEVYSRWPPGVKNKPLTWRMDTRSVLSVGDTYIVGEAWVFNRNPNVLPDTIDVRVFKVRSASRDEGLTLDAIRLAPPERNVILFDIIRLVYKEVDAAGRVTHHKKLDPQEIENINRAWAITAEEALRRGHEHRSRRTALVVIVSGAACLTVALGAVAWWRYRRGRMAA